MRVAVITLFSAARLTHAERQFARVRELAPPDTTQLGATQADVTQVDEGQPDVTQVAVWLDAEPPPTVPGVTLLHVPPGPFGLRLAAGRNAGAERAVQGGADLLVFLDADCLPGAALFERYGAAARAFGADVLCGPVTYLRAGANLAPDALVAATAPHAARPDLAAEETRLATRDEYALFWSLSFAISAESWARASGFDEAFEGYGGEDTDFAWRLRERGLRMRWVGGAHAYHQHHPTSSPPRQHLDDILRNAALFHARWSEWPMSGWLAAFERSGEITFTGGAWVRVSR